MIQGRGGLRFALEASQRLRVFRNLVRKELQGDKTVQLYVFGLVNHTHPASAQLLDDAVVRDGLADHWAEMLRLEVGQVNESVEVGCVPKDQLAKNPDYAQNPVAESRQFRLQLAIAVGIHRYENAPERSREDET